MLPHLAAKTETGFLNKVQKSLTKWSAAEAKPEQSTNTPIKPQKLAFQVGELADDDAIFMVDT